MINFRLSFYRAVDPYSIRISSLGGAQRLPNYRGGRSRAPPMLTELTTRGHRCWHFTTGCYLLHHRGRATKRLNLHGWHRGRTAGA
eukprot:1180669-Prorocentrum_minimum.AAC.4